MKYALVLTTVPQADHLCKSEKTKKIDASGTQNMVKHVIRSLTI